MERIEDLVHPESPVAQYKNVTVRGKTYKEVWLPSRPVPFYNLGTLLADVWAVWMRRATAVQWPDQRR